MFRRPLPGRLGWLLAQVRHARRVSGDLGRKAAVGERLDAATRKSPERLEERRRLARLEAGALASEAHLARLEAGALDTAAHLARLESEAAEVRRVPASVETTAREVLIDWLWAANAPLAMHPLITVILPAGLASRAGFLRGAIDSVRSQTYSVWELLIVDDSAAGYLAELPAWWPADDRIRVLRGSARGAAAARALATRSAAGEIVAYLDDDCRFYPWWLHSVARAFVSDEQLGAVHGIRIVEGSAGQPWAHADSTVGAVTSLRNPVDTNVFAHRADLAPLLWGDTEPDSCSDYAAVVALGTARWGYLPVPAAAYGETSPDRVWRAERSEVNAANRRLVRDRARVARPLRVLAHNSLYPQLSETYVGDELEALRRHGVELALSRDVAAIVPAPSRVEAPQFDSLEEAAATFDPDVVLIHWGDVAIGSRERCRRVGVPYAVRLHSFDAGRAIDQIIDDRCVGVWGFGHFQHHHDRAHHLDTLLVDPEAPNGAKRSRSVLSASALLPKKGFDTLVSAVEMLDDVALTITAARTNGFGHLVDALNGQAAASGAAVDAQFDVSYAQVQAQMRSAGALVYSIRHGTPLGQPRSVIEAGLLGTPLVVPDLAPMRDLVGTTGHFYTPGDAASLAAALDAALDRPWSWEQRLELATRLRLRHADDAAFERWTESLTTAVVAWHRAHRPGRDAANQRFWWPG